AEVERALDAEDQVLAGHEVATDLAAADKRAVRLTAEIRIGGDSRIDKYQVCAHPAPAAADVAAEIAALPVVKERRDDRPSFQRHVRGRGDVGCADPQQC